MNERLRVIYGEQCQLKLKSTPEEGTSVTMQIPDTAGEVLASA